MDTGANRRSLLCLPVALGLAGIPQGALAQVDGTRGFLTIHVTRTVVVTVDGEELGEAAGNTFRRFEVTPGQHAVRLATADGGWVWEGRVMAPRGEAVLLEPTLIPTDPSVGVVGTFIDPRDGQAYRTIKLQGLEWFAENFRMAHPRASASMRDETKVQEYGRFYRYIEAGGLAPNGWRLPSQPDYQALVDIYPEQQRWTALLPGGRSGLAVLMAGAHGPGGWTEPGTNSALWTSSKYVDPHRQILAFDQARRDIAFRPGSVQNAMMLSVRYCRTMP